MPSLGALWVGVSAATGFFASWGGSAEGAGASLARAAGRGEPLRLLRGGAERAGLGRLRRGGVRQSRLACTGRGLVTSSLLVPVMPSRRRAWTRAGPAPIFWRLRWPAVRESRVIASSRWSGLGSAPSSRAICWERSRVRSSVEADSASTTRSALSRSVSRTPCPLSSSLAAPPDCSMTKRRCAVLGRCPRRCAARRARATRPFKLDPAFIVPPGALRPERIERERNCSVDPALWHHPGTNVGRARGPSFWRS